MDGSAWQVSGWVTFLAIRLVAGWLAWALALAVVIVTGRRRPATNTSTEESDTSPAFFWGLGSSLAVVGGLSLLSNGSLWAGDSLFDFWFLGLYAWYIGWFVAVGVWLATCKSFAVGLIAGLGTGIMVLFTSCFINIAGIDDDPYGGDRPTPVATP